MNTAAILRKQRLLSNMRPRFSPRASRLHGVLSKPSLLALARFIQLPKRGRPSFFDLNEKLQLKFDL
jgi:hypothetical protein